MSFINLLIEALFAIYSRAGAEVTYVTDSGQVRPYWANRYLQALKRAVSEGPDAVVAFVERLINQPEPSRGFFYLKEAGRLDLSVEALVVDRSQPFHDVFADETVQVAEARLREHGWVPQTLGPVKASATTTAPVSAQVAGLYSGRKTMTITAMWWYLMTVSGLRLDQVQELNQVMERLSDDHNSPVIGGNHLLEALLETGLYQRVWPGSPNPTN